jgi:hypothetical protein
MFGSNWRLLGTQRLLYTCRLLRHHRRAHIAFNRHGCVPH